MQNNKPPPTPQSPPGTDNDLFANEPKPNFNFSTQDAGHELQQAPQLTFPGDTGVQALKDDFGSWWGSSQLNVQLQAARIAIDNAFDPAYAKQVQEADKQKQEYYRQLGQNIAASSTFNKAWVKEPLHLLGGIASQMTSPTNLMLAALTPEVKGAEELGWAGRWAYRAARGGVIGAASTGLSAPIVNSTTPWSDQHVGPREALSNAIYGAGSEIGIGAFKDIFKSGIMQKVGQSFQARLGKSVTPPEVDGKGVQLEPGSGYWAHLHNSFEENQQPAYDAQLSSHNVDMAKNLQDQYGISGIPASQKFAALAKALDSNTDVIDHYNEVKTSMVDVAKDEADNYSPSQMRTDTKSLTQGELYAASSRLQRTQNLAPELSPYLEPLQKEIKNNTYGFGASTLASRYYKSLDDYSMYSDERAEIRQKYLQSFSPAYERERLAENMGKAAASKSQSPEQIDQIASRLRDNESGIAAKTPISETADEMYAQSKEIKDFITRSDADNISKGAGILPKHLLHDPEAIDVLLEEPQPQKVNESHQEVRRALDRRMGSRKLKRLKQELSESNFKDYKSFREEFFQKVPKDLLRSYRDNLKKVDEYATNINEQMGQVGRDLEHPLFNHIKNMEELATAHSHFSSEIENIGSVNRMLESGNGNVNPFNPTQNYYSDLGNGLTDMYLDRTTPLPSETYGQDSPYNMLYEKDLRKEIDESPSEDDQVPRRTSEEKDATEGEDKEEAQAAPEEEDGLEAAINRDFGSFRQMMSKILTCAFGEYNA